MRILTIGRLVGLVPTFREGPLAASAIRSLLPACDNVIVYEGPIGDTFAESGYETELGEFRKNGRVTIKHGVWRGEAAKRNAMLEATRRMPTPTWGIYLDADEILIGAEYVRDLIWAAEVNSAEGREVTAIPIHITEVDSSVGRIHRIIRLDKLERHVLSMSQLKFFGSNVIPTFPVVLVWRPGQPVTEHNRPPMQGEPHLHHRSYYRPPDRSKFRLHALEVDDFHKLEKEALEKLGLTGTPGYVPVNQDPGFLVASERMEEQHYCAYCSYDHGPECPNGYCCKHDLAPCPFCDPTKTNPLVLPDH